MSQPPSRPVVLVVEDDAFQLMRAVDVVEEAGMDAVEASSSDEAIRILEARSDIRIVFTDIDMPGSLDGMRLAQCIRGRWPPIELIVTSGHRMLQPEDLPERGHFFPKPYLSSEIIAALQDFARAA